MNKPKKTFTFARLSSDFYKEYPQSKYPEIERKLERPYLVLLVKIKGLDFAIPLRSKIKHSNAFFTKRNIDGTYRGLDYSKTVVVTKTNYIDMSKVFIRNDEYKLLTNRSKIVLSRFSKYVESYIQSQNSPSNNDFYRKDYSFSTLQYFHKELGITLTS